jgi:predicted phosphodiesterase
MTQDTRGSISDAELAVFMRLVKKHGSATAAGKEIGLSGSTARDRKRTADARHITAETKVVDRIAQLETKLKIAERELSVIQKDNVTAAEIRKTLYGLAELVPDPPDWIVSTNKPKLTGVPMGMLSDLHWGEKVSLDEMSGLNEFNRKIACQRLKLCTTSFVDLAKNHMVNPIYPGFVLLLGGDMITGDIHEELQDTNDGYVQQSLLELQEQLIAAITTLADEFGRVFVPCVVGNHGRMSTKPRHKGRVYTSFEWNLYCQLERYFKTVGDKRVQFHIPTESDAHFNVMGHRFLLTHGDSLGVKGGDGIIGALGPIARGTMKIGRSESQIGRDFDTLVIGHWHTYIPRGEAVPVIVNGTLKGYDEYARLALRVPYSRPSQALWFVHPKYGITAQWQVFLDEGAAAKVAIDKWVNWRE